MSKARNIADLLDANGDVALDNLDNVPAADLVNDTTPQLGGSLDVNGFNVYYGDNEKSYYGDSNDLEIYHDGGNSRIVDNGQGNLLLLGNDLRLANADWTKNYLRGVNGGLTSIYYDNAEKLATTSTGVDVTGTITADEFDVEGFASGTVVQKQHWKLTSYANTATTSGWLEVTSGNRPQITPVHSNSKFIIECFVNHWGDIDNDGHGYVNGRLKLERVVNGSYSNDLYDEATIIDRAGQTRFRHTVFVEADNNISTGNTYQYEVHAQLSYTSNGRSYNVNSVPSYVIISEVVN